MASKYVPVIHKYADQFGVPRNIATALARAESGINPNARSPVGAIGIMQLMPGTAQGLGVDPHDPEQNIMGGMKYLSSQFRAFGDWKKALAAYNAGPGAVRKYGGVPPYRETQGYVKRVLGYAGESRGGGKGKAFVPGSLAAASTPERPAQGGSDRKALAMGFLFADDPFMSGVMGQAFKRREGAASEVETAIAPPASKPGGSSFKPSGKSTLDRILSVGKRFGLPVTSTTGGKHTQGSFHYASRAADFGLGAGGDALERWARQNAAHIKEFYGPQGWHIENGRVIQGAYPDHGDHYHLAQ